MKVKFVDVGGDKKSWETHFKDITWSAIWRSVRAHGAIHSDDFSITYDEATNEGELWVGEFRMVGKFYTTPDPVKPKVKRKNRR